jgi:hypothetical protein
MNGPDISSAVDDLPLPQEGDVSAVSVQAVVAVSKYIRMILYIMSYMIYVHSDFHAGLIPPLNAEDRCVFTRASACFRIFKTVTEEDECNGCLGSDSGCVAQSDHRIFNPADVDHNMQN